MALSRKTLGAVSVLIIIAGFVGAGYLRVRDANAEAEAGNNPSVETGEGSVLSAAQQFSTEVAQPVSGMAAVLDTLWISVSAAGEAAAIRNTTLTALVAGVVTAVQTRENRGVGQGEVLVQIDTTEYALAVFAAEAALRQAEGDYQAKVLFDDQLEDASVRDERAKMARAISGVDQQEVELRRARMELERTGVRAPFSGRVADLKVVPGQYVNVGDEILTVLALNPIKVEVQVLEADIGFLSAGRSVTLTFSAFPGETFEGRIQTINPLVDPEARTARVTVHVPNPGGRIKPGMYAEARLEAEQFPDRILVPRAAILERDRRNMLYVFEEGRAKWRYVTTGFENDSLVELIEGDEDWVAAGEVVLISGHQYLAHDAAVKLVEDPTEVGGGSSR